MKLITETKFNDVKALTEDTKVGKRKFIEGIFMQADTPNKNGRIYPIGIMKREINRYIQEKVSIGSALGELGHPEGPNINLDKTSHIITELKFDGSDIYGKARIIEKNPLGFIAANLIDEGVTLGVSSRGLGSLSAGRNGLDEVQEDFFLATVDIVADPSAPSAFVRGIMEGKEWVNVNGKFHEKHMELVKKTIKRTSMNRLEEECLKQFEFFLAKISKR